MNKENRIIFLLLIVVVILEVLFVSILFREKDGASQNVEAYEAVVIDLDKMSYQLKVGESIRINAFLHSKNINNVVEWSSSDEGVATVSVGGLVKAIANGRTIITARYDGAEEVTCEIIVSSDKKVEIEELFVDKPSISLEVGQKEKMVITIRPENAENKILVFSSNNEKIAKVSQDGTIEAISKGNAIVSIKSSNGIMVECLVTVLEKEKEKSKEESKPKEDKTVESDKNVNNSQPEPSTNNNIPTNNDKPVVEQRVEVEKVVLDKTSLTMLAYDNVKLNATVIPSNATNKELKWTSSNKNVATVDNNGNVNTLGKGSTIITAKTIDGMKYEQCEITVKHNILVVGNSKTYRPESAFTHHRIGSQFLKLAKEAGYMDEELVSSKHKVRIWNVRIEDLGVDKKASVIKNSEATIATINGTSLEHKIGILDQYIFNEKYDIVVIQEGRANMLNYNNGETYRNSVDTGIKWLKRNLKDFNGKIYFRNNWPNKTENNFSKKIIDMSNNGMTVANTYGLTLIDDTKMINALLNKEIDPYYTDDIHADEEGAYATALCMYTKVFNEDPRNVTWNGFVSASVANEMKQIAYENCR